MSPRSFRPTRWTLGLALVLATACGRNDLTVSAGGGSDGDSSGSDDSTSLDSAESTEGEFTDTFPTTTDPEQECGNGVVDFGEECDGFDLAGQSCGSLGFSGGTLSCLPGCVFDVSGCSTSTCGNGVLDFGEDCDGFDLGGESCFSLGFDGGGSLSCTGSCFFDISGCVDFSCGNGVAEPGEVCDTFDLEGESCVSLGFDGGELFCDFDCQDFDVSGCIFGPGGDCCVANGTPGCDNPGCEAEICSFDPFCCSTEWDQICADAANGLNGDGIGCLACTCGNGTTQSNEVCDGFDLGGQTCISLGFDGGMLGCTPDCSGFDTSGCTANACGNDVIEGLEVCDGFDLGGQSCVSLGFAGGVLSCAGDCSAFDTSGCIGGPMCGNDVAEAPEVCDGLDLVGQTCASIGFAGGTLLCAGDCSGFDTSGCLAQICGNGTLEPPEVCDGLELGGQDCISQGFAGGNLGCVGDCATFDTSGCLGGPVCGDDMIEGAEVCDGLDLGGESCVSQGFAGGLLGCAGDCSGFDTSGCTNCGNDMIEAPEVCDGSDLAGLSCVTLGFDGGNLNCMGDCSSFDTSGCTVVGDDCCAPNGTPGCSNPICEGEVCALNPFCCFVDWDAACADIATGADGGGNECLVCTCGNGALDGNEACDGVDLGGETCVSQGFVGGPLGCAGNCGSFDTSGCFGVGPVCGNGTVEGGEACDGFDLDGEDCVSQGFAGGMLGCAGDCTFDTSGCFGAAMCGNNNAEFPEECDGFDLNGEDCISQGFAAGMLGCAGDCTFDTSGCSAFAGDCCVASGSAGCTDNTCSNDICALDPDCCNIAWDAMCADAASGTDGAGNECLICGFGCNQPLCQTGVEQSVCQGSNQCVADICSVDPFCCNNLWDGLCVNEVGTVCGLICP